MASFESIDVLSQLLPLVKEHVTLLPNGKVNLTGPLAVEAIVQMMEQIGRDFDELKDDESEYDSDDLEQSVADIKALAADLKSMNAPFLPK